MVRKNNDQYWKNREEAEKRWDGSESSQRSADPTRRLQQYYQRAVDNINKDIDAELARIVDDNGNPVNAYKPVSKADMEAYQREAKQVVARVDAHAC